MKTTTRYSPEFRQRAVRMVFEHQGEHKTQWAAIVSILARIFLHKRRRRFYAAPLGGES